MEIASCPKFVSSNKRRLQLSAVYGVLVNGTKPFVGGAANPNEVFSSDGPRKIFYIPNGSAITPGNLLFGTAGGFAMAKLDLAAADGVSARTPGFYPFYGTSAAAPLRPASRRWFFPSVPGIPRHR